MKQTEFRLAGNGSRGMFAIYEWNECRDIAYCFHFWKTSTNPGFPLKKKMYFCPPSPFPPSEYFFPAVDVVCTYAWENGVSDGGGASSSSSSPRHKIHCKHCAQNLPADIPQNCLIISARGATIFSHIGTFVFQDNFFKKNCEKLLNPSLLPSQNPPFSSSSFVCLLSLLLPFLFFFSLVCVTSVDRGISLTSERYQRRDSSSEGEWISIPLFKRKKRLAKRTLLK